ncbi:GNAT family N-acetyltransferase [Trinickia sp. EG282A]|uniref:GNAT family N-acetyltransferase n=1 Tax=Trinickia sp. EG282A TaxID=3237013 RepID=UPI0034D2140E
MSNMATEAAISLHGVFSGNPFAEYPQLREIFDPERSAHVEADTLADIALGVHDPHRNQIYVARSDAGEVVGITGFFQPAAEPTTERDTIALRWHGVLPAYRGRGYSEAMFEAVQRMAMYYMPEAKWFVELVPMSDPQKASRIVRHFRKLGFWLDGEPKDATTYPAGTALPVDSGLWQTMRRDVGSIVQAHRYEITRLGMAAIDHNGNEI